MMDTVQKALQDICDSEGDGWMVAHYAVAVGLERMSGDGVESSIWLHCPTDQTEYATKGLLDAAKAQGWDDA